jgi:hypothetical protein
MKIKYAHTVRPSALPTVHSMNFNSYNHIYDQVVLAQQKFNKYFDYTDNSPVYAAATFLYPTQKWEYFTK